MVASPTLRLELPGESRLRRAADRLRRDGSSTPGSVSRSSRSVAARARLPHGERDAAVEGRPMFVPNDGAPRPPPFELGEAPLTTSRRHPRPSRTRSRSDDLAGSDVADRAGDDLAPTPRCEEATPSSSIRATSQRRIVLVAARPSADPCHGDRLRRRRLPMRASPSSRGCTPSTTNHSASNRTRNPCGSRSRDAEAVRHGAAGRGVDDRQHLTGRR